MTPIAISLAKRVSPTPPSEKVDVDINGRSTSKISVLKARKLVKDTDLCNPQFMAYHIGFVRRYGPQTYVDLAEVAREGKDPSKLMSWLLKEESSNA